MIQHFVSFHNRLQSSKIKSTGGVRNNSVELNELGIGRYGLAFWGRGDRAEVEIPPPFKKHSKRKSVVLYGINLAMRLHCR